jgi:hypothetical protein
MPIFACCATGCRRGSACVFQSNGSVFISLILGLYVLLSPDFGAGLWLPSAVILGPAENLVGIFLDKREHACASGSCARACTFSSLDDSLSVVPESACGDLCVQRSFLVVLLSPDRCSFLLRALLWLRGGPSPAEWQRHRSRHRRLKGDAFLKVDPAQCHCTMCFLRRKAERNGAVAVAGFGCRVVPSRGGATNWDREGAGFLP